MAELEIREPGGDGSAGAANLGFQTALSFPTLSVCSNQGGGGGVGGDGTEYMQAGCAPCKGLG